jgi:ABC-type transport system substrate-binding protein
MLSRLLVRSFCLLLLAGGAVAASRPHYGGVLRIETRADAGAPTGPLGMLVFENLTMLDDAGRAAPRLALSWESQNGDRRWRFVLRHDARFHDGTPLTAAAVVTSLTSGQCENCPWISVRASGDAVLFELADARPGFAAELALPRYAIVARTGGGPIGTGPFRWGEPRNAVQVLEANEDYWGGRPFLNSVELGRARSARDQLVNLELGRSDVAEIAPDQVRRVSKARTLASSPAELIALVIRPSKPALQNPRIRQALALSIDRVPIYNVVLQKQGEIAGGLLPGWISGYAFLLPAARDLPRAQELVREAGAPPPPLTIAIEESDAALQLIAERIALNAHESGFVLQPIADKQQADLLVVRHPLNSINPEVAFEEMSESFGQHGDIPVHTPAGLFEQERQIVSQGNVVPLAYVPRVCAVGPRVRNWNITPDGRWRLDNVWLDTAEAGR